MISVQNFKTFAKSLRNHLTERFSIEKKHEEFFAIFRRYEIGLISVAKVFEKLETVLDDLDVRLTQIEGTLCLKNEDTSRQKNTKTLSSQDQDLS